MVRPTRVYKLTQNVRNSRTGERLYSAEQLRRGLDRRTIKGWAYALHDQDVGDDHLQAVWWTEREVPVETQADWFDVPPQQIQRVRGGRAGLVNELRYLTHEDDAQQALGKVRYPDSAIQATPGWDWRAEVDEAMARRAESGSSRQRSRSVEAAMHTGQSVREARLRGGSVESRLRRMRAAYLAQASPPPLRIVYYLYGDDDLGCEALGRGLAGHLAGDHANVFVGGRSFDYYDGEPVIFWPNADPLAMMTGLGANGIFSLLRPLPERALVENRYGPTQLIHEHLVLAGRISAETFRAQLAMLYGRLSLDPRRDSYVHMPVLIPVAADSLAVQVNEGVLGEGPFEQYRQLGAFRLGLAEAMERVRFVEPAPARAALERRIVSQQVEPIVAAGAIVRGQLAASPPDDMEAVLAGIGMPLDTGSTNNINYA